LRKFQRQSRIMRKKWKLSDKMSNSNIKREFSILKDNAIWGRVSIFVEAVRERLEGNLMSNYSKLHQTIISDNVKWIR
jgi:hypothetical protein